MWYHRFFFILKREKETLNIRAFNPFREQVNETNSTKLKTRDKAYFLLLTRGDREAGHNAALENLQTKCHRNK